MSIDDADLIHLRRFIAPFVRAVAIGDQRTVERLYAEVADLVRVYPSHALAVVLADEVRQGRDRLAVAQAEATEYAGAYLDQKRRVVELRNILESTGKRVA